MELTLRDAQRAVLSGTVRQIARRTPLIGRRENSAALNAIRLLVLTVGPLILIGGAYALTYSAPHPARSETSTSLELAERRAVLARADRHATLEDRCRDAANELWTRLPPGFAVIARAPFVIAGNAAEEELDRLHRETIRPVTEALWRSYFDRRPDQPVTIVALSNEVAYRRVAMDLDGYEPTAYAGYTQRGVRRIVVNLATGPGTLTHELAHVLACFDFPDMPEWFDEGLAALHEDAVFSPDGLTLVGTANWRNRLVHSALDSKELPTLTTLIRTRTFRGEGENLNYAFVRCLCLYLQERGLLGHFYRKFRARIDEDPSGLQTLRELLGVASDAEIDRDFRRWAAKIAIEK